MKLFFDTETTGKVLWERGAHDPRQPRLVQLAALLMNDRGEEAASLNCIIDPVDFEIPAEAAAIHGITTDYARKAGVSLGGALCVFNDFCRKADTLVAHNLEFDLMVIRSELHRVHFEEMTARLEPFCTMRAMTEVCKLPGKRGDYKWPKLSEAYRHCFNAEMEGAHDALADVQAAADVYFWLQRQLSEEARP